MPSAKNVKFEVKEYSFGQLVPSSNGHGQGISKYELQSLNEIANFKQSISETAIRTERAMESQSGFAVDPIIREMRGLKRQEEEDYEARIQAEVERRVAAIREQAFEEGFAQGEERGHEEARIESEQKYNQMIDQFSNQLAELNDQIREIYDQSKHEAYQMVKSLTKWIILKEVDEKYYLVRLLEKLIYEINTKSNLVVRVNEGAFGYMPEVIKIVEREMGKLPNVRVEVDLDQNNNGIILESENTIVDGSLETQFKSIDRIFENAGIDEN